MRGGAADAGGPLAGLTANETEYFTAGLEDFEEAEDVPDGIGPSMNLDGCGGCHSQPAIGGTSPAVNPQVAFATQDGGHGPRAVVHLAERARARSAVREKSRRHARRRRARAVHHHRTDGRRRLQPRAARLRRASSRTKRDLPHSHAGVRRRPDRADPGLRDPRQPGRQRVHEELAGHPRPAELRGLRPDDHRPDEQQRQRRHHRPLRLEGAEQVAAAVLGRGLQRRDGHHQRAVPDRTGRDAGCQFATVPNDAQQLRRRPTRSTRRSPRSRTSPIFMRFLAPPTPSSDTPGGATSIANGKSLFSDVGCAFCHTPSFRPATPRSPR